MESGKSTNGKMITALHAMISRTGVEKEEEKRKPGTKGPDCA